MQLTLEHKKWIVLNSHLTPFELRDAFRKRFNPLPRKEPDQRTMALGFLDGILPEWASLSPDLNPCDFWLWGTINARLNSIGWPKSDQTMKLAIQKIVDSMEITEVNAAILNIYKQMNACIQQKGDIFEHTC